MVALVELDRKLTGRRRSEPQLLDHGGKLLIDGARDGCRSRWIWSGEREIARDRRAWTPIPYGSRLGSGDELHLQLKSIEKHANNMAHIVNIVKEDISTMLDTSQ